MKVGAISEAFRFLNVVRERKEGESSERHPDENARRDQDESPEGTREELQNAVSAFAADAQAQSSGLSAELVDQGRAGLRVILRDASGTVIRQMSGYEFLRMRQTASVEPLARGRGKLLDQKY